MELKQVQDSSLYKPCLRDEQQQRFDQSAELMNIDQCQTIGDMDDSQLVGAPVNVAAGCDHVAAAGENGLPVKVEVKLAEKTVEKRRRGRPPRGQVKTTPVRKKTDEEDVCFICFDGGSLVLCDRRGCPKAYHPSCIKRDEAFFRSKAKWNCGWHICISCQKASHYMCYTCTFSLCKGCTKDTDYLCVRGNKGFCGTCMRTVMLIENLQGSTEMAKVDFDDKSSWEYLFKMYWIFLKGKLSLTLDELIKAKNPWKPPPAITSKGESSGEFYDGSNKTSFVSDNSYADPKAICLKGKTTTKKGISKEDCLGTGKLGGYTVAHFSGDTNWASKELLEFVAYMKNGDISVLSQFDVQVLLLEYIKKNNLRDPSQKCQILCDSRLLNLFGKACVGHFEMLKLLESHFLVKEGSGADTTIQVGGIDAIARQVESDWSSDNQIMAVNDKRRKTRRRVDERRQQSNPVAYAAIDVYNINLIYLRRDLIVNLIEDVDKFHDKVVGSIVRIRISSCDQKPDMHRLVQVVGTSKVMEPYKIGTKTTDVMLEILNLDKKEVISIDGISNLEFDQDECERLHQSIKCGFIKRLTVGEIQQKAKVLQAVKVNDWLEAEVLKLNHLRDRASEKGHRKELRECVEKLQLLNSPEERQRRLQEVPVVHSDPNMDPNCESEDNGGELDEKKRGSQDNKVKPRNSGFGRKRREPASPRKGADLLVNSGNKAQKLLTASEQNRDKEAFGINVCNTVNDQADPSDPVINGWSNQAVVGSDTFSGVASESTGLLLSTGTNLSVNDFETDRIWHYQDPTGKIQGPFNMLQLRKWGTGGLFPSDLKIWRINEKQDNSILLTDALTLQSYHEPLLRFNSHLPSQRVEVASDNQCNGGDAGSNNSMNAIPIDGKRVEESINLEQDNPSKHIDGDNEPVRSIGWGSLSSSCTTLPDVVNSNEEHTGIFSQGWDSLKGNNPWPNQPQLQVCSSLTPPVFPQKQNTSPQIREDHESERTSDQNNGNLNACPTADGQTSNGQGYENRSDSEGHSGQSSTQNWRPPPVNSPSQGWDSNSCFTSVAKSLETSEKNRKEIDFPDFPSPTPKQSNGDLEGQPAENKQSASSNAPVQDVGVSWSTASSLVGGGAQLHEVAGEWGGYSSTPAKPPVEEWDSSLVSVSSLKPNEMASDHAGTPASMSEQLTHSSPSHPASNTSSWQAIVDEPNEFSSLVDESVADLLAEVEAMESLNGLASSTIISSGGELIGGSKNDCVSSVEGFSPAPDPGKGDALSSTGDIHLPPQSTMTDEPLKVDKADALDPQNRSNGHSPTSVEQEGDAKHSDVSVNQLGCEAPSTASWDVSTVDTHHWNARSESMDTSWGAVQGNASIDWSGLDQGNAVMRWGTTQGTTQESSNMNSGTSTPTGNFWGSQPRYGGERFFGPRDRVFQGRDSGYGRGRHAWNRQQFGGGGSGGGPYRPPSKGQRICKFYESGYCKKGASCSYLHP